MAQGMTCDDVRAALSAFEICVETEEGSRVTTHCLYPSFDPVNVYVVRFGDGFRVHDGGGALKAAWTHGREEPAIKKALGKKAARFEVNLLEDCSLVVDAPSVEWLTSAILAVANASAAAAHDVVDKVVSATERVLRDRILDVLKRTVRESAIAPDFGLTGKSGKVHHFDFAVQEPNDKLLLISAVAPHHISVSSKYVAFSDLIFRTDGRVDRFAVHDRPLDPSDVSLLLQVAEIVPVTSLRSGIERIGMVRA
jgi:hypothetical protein